MSNWYIIGAFALIVLVAFPLTILISAAGGWLVSKRREQCPSCGHRALCCVQFIVATVLVDGKRAPDSFRYLLCESCGAHYKQHLGRDFEIPSETDWEQHCGRRVLR